MNAIFTTFYANNNTIEYSDLDTTKTPCELLLNIVKTEGEKADFLFENVTAKEQFLAGDINDKATIGVTSAEGDITVGDICNLDWRTPICESPDAYKLIKSICSSGRTPLFLLSVPDVVG